MILDKQALPGLGQRSRPCASAGHNCPHVRMEAERRCAEIGTGAQGRTGGPKVVVALPIWFIVNELGVGADRTHGSNVVLQFPVSGAVAVHKIMEILIVRSGVPVFGDAVARRTGLEPVAIDDVVADDRVVVRYRSRETAGIVTVADQNAAVTVVKDRVVGDGHLVCGMPQVDAPTFAPVHKIVPNVATKIGVVDPMVELTRAAKVSNIVHYVADHVVVVPGTVIVVDDGAAIYASRAVIAHVVHVISDDPHVRGVVDDAVAGVRRSACNVKALNVDIVSEIGPHDIDRTCANCGAPLLVGNKTDARGWRTAGLRGNRARIIARSHMNGCPRPDYGGGMLNREPGTQPRTIISVFSRGGYVVVRNCLRLQ